MNYSCHTCECVMSLVCMSHRTHERGISYTLHILTRYFINENESSHIMDKSCAIHVNMQHITHMNELFRTHSRRRSNS